MYFFILKEEFTWQIDAQAPLLAELVDAGTDGSELHTVAPDDQADDLVVGGAAGVLAGHDVAENWHLVPIDLLGGLADLVSAMLGDNLDSAYCVALPEGAVAIYDDLIAFFPARHLKFLVFDAGDKLPRLEPIRLHHSLWGIGSRDDEVGTLASFTGRIDGYDFDAGLVAPASRECGAVTGRWAIDLDPLKVAHRRLAQDLCLRLPTGADQAHHLCVLAGEILRADRRGACDTEFLQIAVMNHGQQLAGLGAVEIDHSAEFTVVRAGYTDLAHFLAAFDVGDDVGVDAVGRNVETPYRAGQRREGVVRGVAAFWKFRTIVLAVTRREYPVVGCIDRVAGRKRFMRVLKRVDYFGHSENLFNCEIVDHQHCPTSNDQTSDDIRLGATCGSVNLASAHRRP